MSRVPSSLCVNGEKLLCGRGVVFAPGWASGVSGIALLLGLGENLFDDLAVGHGEAFVAAVMAVG